MKKTMKKKNGKKSKFGMLSVKAGIDNNPKPTAADRIAGATKGKKKMMGGGMMKDDKMMMGYKKGGSKKANGGLYANIAAKKARIKAGSGEKMRKKGAKGAPTKANFTRAAQTARKK